LNSKPPVLQSVTANSGSPQEEGVVSPDLDGTPDDSDKPLPIRSVLTRPVVVSVANYAMLALLNAVVESCVPLVWSTPVEYGGLSMSPASIGLWLSLSGCMGGVFQFLFFSRCVSRFGLRRVFVFSIASNAANFAILPLENLAMVAGGGPNLVVWLLIILQLLSWCVGDMGYGKFYALAHADAHDARGSLRYSVYVHFVCCPQQTFSRLRIWSVAGSILDSESRWTGCCGRAVCVLSDA
jgi:hypothetical protein